MAARWPGRVTSRTGGGRVVLTFARSWYTVAAARSLGRRGIEVFAGDEFALTPASLSRHTSGSFRYPGHERDEAGFLDALESTLSELAPDDPEQPYVLLPMHREGYLIARHRERFESIVDLALPDAKQLEIAGNKRSANELARSLGVPVPRTWLPRTIAEARRAAGEVDYPAFVKQPQSAGGVGVERVRSSAELVEAFAELRDQRSGDDDANPLVQTSAPGEDYCVSALYDQGEPVAALTYRNVASFPRESGPGAVRETVSAPRLEALSETLLRSLGWHGIAQVDFRWDGEPDSTPLFIEINPRFFSGLFHAIASGVDYPWLMFRMAAGLPVEEVPEPDAGVRTETPVVGLLATASEMLGDDEMRDSLERAWAEGKETLFGDEPLWTKLISIGRALRENVDVKRRLDHVRSVIEENRDNISSLIEEDDPLPALGMLYPIVVFLERGSVSAEILAGAERPRDA